MKKLLTIIVTVLLTIAGFAQAPQKMSYQAVIRDNSGVLVTNTQIGIEINIRQGSPAGTVVYTESQTPTSNANGLISIEIGGAGLSAINWASDEYYLETKTAIAPPLTTYTITGVSQLLSVPYALHAETADSITGIITETDPLYSASIAAGITAIDTAWWNAKYELPALTSGSVLFSNGSTLVEDNNNLYWDNANKRLGIGTNTPSSPLELKSSMADQTRTIMKVLNSNGDSVLTIAGNGAAISLDSASGNFRVWQLSASGKKTLMKLNPSNTFIGYNAGLSNTTGYSNIFLGDNAGSGNQTGEHNVFIGHSSGYSGTQLKRNIFIGDSAGYFTNNLFATSNVFIGYAAGKNSQSYNNIYVGTLAGWSNSSGQSNIAIGDKAGYSNTTSQNIFIGTEAGLLNTSGYFNIMMGRYAGHSNTTGFQQVLIGGSAGVSLTTGSENVMVGTSAGAMNSEGIGNVFLGTSAGWSNTGSYNVIIGYKTGYGAFQTVSNRLIIDGGAVTTPLVWGEFDNRRFVINGTSASNINNRTFFTNGSSGGTGAWWNDSDERLKKNIKTIEDPLKKVLGLRGVNYEWKDTTNHEKGLQIGFIAQEVVQIIPEVVSRGEGMYAMQYAPLTALLVEAIKEQQKKIDSLELLNEKVSQLEEQNKKLMNDLELIKEQLKLNKN